jgi:RimJ/RimL family protein N-acetyltransferase
MRRSAWGKGYATEGSRAPIRKGFTQLGMQRVMTEKMAVNVASRRMLENAGLTHTRTFHGEWLEPIAGAEQGEVQYALTNADWEWGSGGARTAVGLAQDRSSRTAEGYW